jgi:hypothetical protein
MSLPKTRILLPLLAVLPIACARLDGDQSDRPQVAYEVSPAEICLARDLAERDLVIPEKPLRPSDKVCFIKVDLIPDSQAQTTQRQVVVTHYRYRDDAALLTTVDLNRLEVLKAEAYPHFPTGLAAEERRRAEELAKADPRLKGLFETHGRLTMEARSSTQPSPQDCFYGHRIVHLLLNRGGNYLHNPRVIVDLTSETVHVEAPDEPAR